MKVVPAGWRCSSLGDVCRVTSGATPKTSVKEYWGGAIPWITPNDMSKDRSRVLHAGERWLTDRGYASCSAQLFPSGSVIVSSRAPIGYVAIAGREMCTNQGCKTATPPPELDSNYLYWFMINAKSDLEARASGTTFKEISSRRFSETLLWWPEIGEQRRIVAILEEHLSDLDAGLSYVDSGAARLVHLRRAELDRIFGTGAGPALPLGDLIADISAGKSFGSAERPAAPDEWGIIKVSAMTWGEFRPDENKAVSADLADPRFEIRAGDLLVSRANTSDYVGASVLVPAGVRPKLLLSDKSLRVLPRPDINPEWLWRALQAPGARRQMSVLATGTKESMRNISQESLKRVVVPVVDGSEQGKSTAEFAGIESAIRRQLGILASLRSRAGGLRRAVLAAAFSGRLTGHGADTELIEELAEGDSA